jgi:hypothetical protein
VRFELGEKGSGIAGVGTEIGLHCANNLKTSWQRYHLTTWSGDQNRVKYVSHAGSKLAATELFFPTRICLKPRSWTVSSGDPINFVLANVNPMKFTESKSVSWTLPVQVRNLQTTTFFQSEHGGLQYLLMDDFLGGPSQRNLLTVRFSCLHGSPMNSYSSVRFQMY